MTLKDIVWNLTPPIVVKLWHKIRGDINEQNVTTKKTDKELIFEYINEVNRRKYLSFMDIDTLSKPFTQQRDYDDLAQQSICFGSTEPVLYGAYHVLNKYIGCYSGIVSGDFKLQHGFMFDERLPISVYNGFSKYICWGNSEKDYIQRNLNLPVYTIGSPFFYVDSLLSEAQLSEEKRRLGRNLLVFPCHSLLVDSVSYSEADFIDFIKEEGKKFDSVRICLYWADIIKGTTKIYEEQGFECVCAGHISDLNFLSRQKSIIETCDCVLSNEVGSYVGYALSLGKPFLLYDQNLTCTESDTGKSHTMRVKYNKLFSENYDYNITDEQIDFVNYYWGLTDKRSPEELYRILYEL